MPEIKHESTLNNQRPNQLERLGVNEAEFVLKAVFKRKDLKTVAEFAEEIGVDLREIFDFI